ncbi:MAG: trimethylamine methyltransferase family protein [Chloroflexi bacterium]|nr:trimethylamine methyltransferase family protein [Chloroflexota bacterium]
MLHFNPPMFKLPFFRKLSDAQIQQIHAASLEIVERFGLYVHDDDALALLKKANVPITDGNCAHLPVALIEWAYKLAPKSITLYNRLGQPVMPLEGYNVFYGPGSDCPNVIDLDSGELRLATLKDVADGVRLCDALKNIDFIMSFCLAGDVDQNLLGQLQMREILINSIKPSIFVTTDFSSVEDIITMAEIVMGGEEALRQKPITACYINVTGPLRHNQEALQKLLYLAKKGLPTTYVPVVLRGLNGPVTPAGALALSIAGEMLGVVLAQLVREGAPVIVSGGTNDTVDMRTLVGSYAAPENRVMFMEMAHAYGLPIFGLGGGSDSKLPDEQAAAEAALTLLAETLSGAHLIHDVGYLGSGMVASYEQMVICNDIIQWIKRFTQPIEVNDDTLGLDLIAEYGADGQYLHSEHTTGHFRQDWYSQLFDRQHISGWEEAGKTTLRQRAIVQTRKLLEKHHPEPLPADVLKGIDQVIERARQR